MTNVKWVILLLLCAVNIAHAETRRWRCQAHDTFGRTWQSVHGYEQGALNVAYEKCQKQSMAPVTCKVAHRWCKLFVRNPTKHWLCRAFVFDDEGVLSTAHARRSTREDSTKFGISSAIKFCQKKSSMPKSCYVNKLVCLRVR